MAADNIFDLAAGGNSSRSKAKSKPKAKGKAKPKGKKYRASEPNPVDSLNQNVLGIASLGLGLAVASEVMDGGLF